MNDPRIEAEIIARAPRRDWFVGQPVGCTFGHCQQVKRMWGICMCELVRRLQDQQARSVAKGG